VQTTQHNTGWAPEPVRAKWRKEKRHPPPGIEIRSSKWWPGSTS